jgi:hypothetical protein
MEAMGHKVADPNLVTLGILAQGRTLIKRGQTVAGLALLDDAMLAATSAKLDPVWSGAVYCPSDGRMSRARRPPARRGLDPGRNRELRSTAAGELVSRDLPSAPGSATPGSG